jgi:hypothetical protein
MKRRSMECRLCRWKAEKVAKTLDRINTQAILLSQFLILLVNRAPSLKNHELPEHIPHARRETCKQQSPRHYATEMEQHQGTNLTSNPSHQESDASNEHSNSNITHNDASASRNRRSGSCHGGFIRGIRLWRRSRACAGWNHRSRRGWLRIPQHRCGGRSGCGIRNWGWGWVPTTYSRSAVGLCRCRWRGGCRNGFRFRRRRAVTTATAAALGTRSRFRWCRLACAWDSGGGGCRDIRLAAMAGGAGRVTGDIADVD